MNHPNLTERQAREAIAKLVADMAAAPEGPPVKVRERIAANLLRDWQQNAQGARFTLHAVYYRLANFAA